MMPNECDIKIPSSLDFVKFTTGDKIATTTLSETFGTENLIRALRDVEKELVDIVKKPMEKRRLTEEERRLYQLYLRLGNINLLAEDFARAMSAYQMAYKYNKAEFWKDPCALYGLAMTYYHFRAYQPAIELFSQLLFTHPYCEVVAEVHGRIGFCFKALDNNSQALKHLNIALDDSAECPAFSKSFLRFQIAHTFDIAGEIRRSVEEYKRLLSDNERGIVRLSNQLLSAIYARLGWICLCSREREPREEQRHQKLKEAEAFLLKARELSPVDGKTNCYLGLCYSEQTRVANSQHQGRQLAQQEEPGQHQQATGQISGTQQQGIGGIGDQQGSGQPFSEGGTAARNQVHHSQFVSRYNADQAAQNAFISYRTAIDSDESDPNTWRSIALLYEQQNQPHDALQSFTCAVQLNDKHFAAWVDLGQLYERHRQYKDALSCYKKAFQATSEPPERLRARITVIERELAQIGGPANYSLLESARRPESSLLPQIENAWQLGIPTQVRQRLADLKKQQENKYREGSSLWNMQELVAKAVEADCTRTLTPTQRQILQILKMNKDQLEVHESTLLRELEQRVRAGTAEPTTLMEGEKDDNLTQKEKEQTIQSEDIHQESIGTLSTSIRQRHEKNSAGLSGLSTILLSPKDETLLEGDQNQQSTSQVVQEERISSTFHHPELPPNLSLLAPVRVPITVTSAEILEICKKRFSKPDEYRPVFDEQVPPPEPPKRPEPELSKDKLLLKTPVVLVENQKEAGTIELQQFCYNQPIALIHGLTLALKMDLSQFSTKTLIQTAPEHEVEVRNQYRMPSYDVNVDHMGNPTWAMCSSKCTTTISGYGQYQAEMFKYSLKEETEKLRQANPKLYGPPPQSEPLQALASTSGTLLPDITAQPVPPSKKRKTAGNTPNRSGTANHGSSCEENNPFKMIKFGTNVDLSDERKFYYQLRELNKLPAFCRIQSASNMLSYLGHTVLGMNTVQLYLKVPGCRTPGHLENNCFASVNVNIGPGECEWYGVPYEYWPAIERMCKERNIDFMRGAWWPNLADFIRERIPFYRFTQRAGDVVWVNGGCVHWVQSTGWCNNVAWNVGPMTTNQMEMALVAHEWNRLNSYQSLVPMQHLCWSLARDVRFSNQKLYNLVKNMLIRSLAYCQMLVDFVGVAMKNPIKKQQRQKGECAHYCHLCEIEVFNLLFVKEIGGKWKIFCVQCARRNSLEDYVVLQQCDFEELQQIFDRFQLHPAKPSLIC